MCRRPFEFLVVLVPSYHMLLVCRRFSFFLSLSNNYEASFTLSPGVYGTHVTKPPIVQPARHLIANLQKVTESWNLRRCPSRVGKHGFLRRFSITTHSGDSIAAGDNCKAKTSVCESS